MEMVIKVGDRLIWKELNGFKQYSGTVAGFTIRQQHDTEKAQLVNTDSGDRDIIISMTEVKSDMSGQEQRDKWLYPFQIKQKLDI
jgi:hypothetical protein